MFFLVNVIFSAGFKGKDCSVDIDLCPFGLCGEHTLICAETRGGQDVTCTCERGERAFSRCHICCADGLKGQSDYEVAESSLFFFFFPPKGVKQ